MIRGSQIDKTFAGERGMLLLNPDYIRRTITAVYSVFPDGVSIFCDHGLDLWDYHTWEFISIQRSSVRRLATFLKYPTRSNELSLRGHSALRCGYKLCALSDDKPSCSFLGIYRAGFVTTTMIRHSLQSLRRRLLCSRNTTVEWQNNKMDPFLAIDRIWTETFSGLGRFEFNIHCLMSAESGLQTHPWASGINVQ